MNKVLLIVGLAALAAIATHTVLTSRQSSYTSISDMDLKDFAHLANFEAKLAAFRDWVVEYNKHYSLSELPARFKIWSDNYDIVEEHNAKNLSWTLGMNHLADLTSEEHAALNLGFDRTLMSQDRSDLNIEELDESLTATAIDWRSKGAVSAIRNQGQCGACWAFASAAALEGLSKIRKGGSVQTYSPQQLVDCARSDGNQGCNGGTMVATFKYTQRYGIELESAYPYRGAQSSCRYSSSKVAFKHSSYKSLGQSYTQLEAALSSQPVTVAVQASASAFQLYKSGVISSNCGTNLDHAITAVGFTNSYWIVKNSWGTGWGNRGYVYIAKGNQNSGRGVCGINMMNSYPTL